MAGDGLSPSGESSWDGDSTRPGSIGRVIVSAVMATALGWGLLAPGSAGTSSLVSPLSVPPPRARPPAAEAPVIAPPDQGQSGSSSASGAPASSAGSSSQGGQASSPSSSGWHGELLAASLPESGALFGAHVQVSEHTGPNRRAAWTNFENEVGRRMALDRKFYKWDDQFPTEDDVWSESLGRRLVLSWSGRRHDGSHVRWADVAAGKYDRAIDQRAAGLKKLRGPIYFTFDPEPMKTPQKGPHQGSPGDFVRAYKHIRDRFIGDGVRNVLFAVTLAASAYGNGKAKMFWPGAAYVDFLAADGYNWYGCGDGDKWRSFRQVFKGFYEWGRAKRKPMMVLEWGTGEDSVRRGRKAQWISDAAATLKKWPLIKGVTYFHSGLNENCPRWVDTSDSSLAAFRAMGADPYFRP